jgi:hypothetical protein
MKHPEQAYRIGFGILKIGPIAQRGDFGGRRGSSRGAGTVHGPRSDRFGQETDGCGPGARCRAAASECPRRGVLPIIEGGIP